MLLWLIHMSDYAASRLSQGLEGVCCGIQLLNECARKGIKEVCFATVFPSSNSYLDTLSAVFSKQVSHQSVLSLSFIFDITSSQLSGVKEILATQSSLG